MLIDTHTHLAHPDLAGNIDKVIRNAQKANVQKIISIGCTLREIKASLNLANQFGEVFSTAGLYPNDTADELHIPDHEKLQKVKNFAENKKIVAIGECGFDFSNPPPGEVKRQEDDQEKLFRSQIQIARELNLPVIIHSRNAKLLTLKVVQDEMKKSSFQAVWHCFTEDTSTAKSVTDMGLYLSFNGIITYKSGLELVQVLKSIPVGQILIETDSPYLVPQDIRSRGTSANEPSFITHIAKKIADILGITLDKISDQTTKNALRLYTKLNEVH